MESSGRHTFSIGKADKSSCATEWKFSRMTAGSQKQPRQLLLQKRQSKVTLASAVTLLSQEDAVAQDDTVGLHTGPRKPKRLTLNSRVLKRREGRTCKELHHDVGSKHLPHHMEDDADCKAPAAIVHIVPIPLVARSVDVALFPPCPLSVLCFPWTSRSAPLRPPLSVSDTLRSRIFHAGFREGADLHTIIHDAVPCLPRRLPM